MLEITLSKGKKAKLDSWNKHLAEMKWCFHHDGYAVKTLYFGRNQYKSIFLHHAVAGYPLNGLQIDHINGNKLDNRLSNLRLATRRENALNRNSRRLNQTASKYPGVTKYKTTGKWTAQISIDKKKHYLGIFESEIEAANAYQKRINEMYGSPRLGDSPIKR